MRRIGTQTDEMTVHGQPRHHLQINHLERNHPVHSPDACAHRLELPKANDVAHAEPNGCCHHAGKTLRVIGYGSCGIPDPTRPWHVQRRVFQRRGERAGEGLRRCG